MLDSKTKYTSLKLVINSKHTEKVVKSNSLDVNNCLFSPELLTYLLKSNLDKLTSSVKCPIWNNRKVFKDIDEKGIYIITFRILNKKEKILVYNYIYYNDLLYLTLIVYFSLRNQFITHHSHEWGKYLIVLDNIFLDYINVTKYIDLYNSKDKTWSKH